MNDDSILAPPQKLPWGEIPVLCGRFVMIFTRLVAVPVEALLRRNFGERYIGGILALCSWTVVLLWADIAENGPPRFFPQQRQAQAYWGAPARQAEESKPVQGAGQGIRNLVALSFVFTLWHWIAIDRRNRKKIRCHSRYPGDPWPVWRVRKLGYATVVHVVEPLFCVVLGLVLSFSTGGKSALGGYLFAAGLALLLHAAVARMIERRKRLDAIDHQIEAQAMAAAVAEWKEPGIESTAGFEVPEHFKASTPAERLDYLRATSALPPELRKLVQESAEEKPAEKPRKDDPGGANGGEGQGGNEGPVPASV